MASILSQLDLHSCLRARVHQLHPPPSQSVLSSMSNGAETFILYLPTVSIRYEQNPSFALACHAANHLNVPLVVLAVVVDDAYHACTAHPHRFPPTMQGDENIDINSRNLNPSVVMTSRRLAFTLQALSHTCSKWSEHGAAVGIRIHSHTGGQRTPDHLTLASRSSLVVTDEPFVSPYTTFVRRVEEACRKCNVECLRVDGSCTVPPVQVLKKRKLCSLDNGSNKPCSKIKYDGVPDKAYAWRNKTEHLRESHLTAAREGYFDAPKLTVCMEDDDLFIREETSASQEDNSAPLSVGQRLAHLFPSRWKQKSKNNVLDDNEIQISTQGIRPYTSCELSKMYQNIAHVGAFTNETEQQSTRTKTLHHPFHNFALNWPGADPTVPPCSQTIGTTPHGMRRWNKFVQSGGLLRYGKERNDPRLVYSVSRMSAYLNLGIVSIFALVLDVKNAQKMQQQARSKGNDNCSQTAKGNIRWDKSGADKFEEEIVKWREMSYAHAFSREDYDDVGSLPQWSVSYLNSCSSRGDCGRYTIHQLANGTTGDAKWDAMQKYLMRTGELHNNARMTWGKTVVEWLSSSAASDDSSCISASQLILRTLCYLNDRYALDGLSPPSYAGLLWCMGWTDKPSGGNSGGSFASIKFKPARLYRWNQDDFRVAEKKLLAPPSIQDDENEDSSCIIHRGPKRKRSVMDMIRS